jgi:integrase
MAQITDLKARNVQPAGKPLADGTVTGLRLEPGAAKGEGKWILRFVSPASARRRDMGLGAYPAVSIAEARKSALAARELLRVGLDPIESRLSAKAGLQAAKQALTFEQAAREVHGDLAAGWKNSKHAAQWLTTLEVYVFPKIGNRKIKELKAADFADALRPLWLKKPETASRVKQRCGKVMDWCVAQDLIGANPVGVVSRLLPKAPGKRERVQHQPALPWREIPSFVTGVLRAGRPSLNRVMLEFLILTAARSGEVRAMTWSEVDFAGKVWTVPAERMKAKAAHRVPLSARALEILKGQHANAAHDELVFPSPRGLVATDMILTMFLRDHKVQSSEPGRVATAHGFRSSFRDWASENSYPRDLAERALAHTIANKAEAAYHRTDLLEQRRTMMEAWSDFVIGTDQHRNGK